MVHPRIAMMALCLVSVPAAVMAETRCNVPLAQWHPREALEEKLKSDGWTVERIHTDDGCYKVRATGPDGMRLKAKFDPATLEKLETPKRDE